MSRKWLIGLILLLVPFSAYANELLFPEAVQRYNNGLKKQQDGRYDDAVSEYSTGLMLMGDKAELFEKFVLNNYAVMAVQRGEYDAAEKLLKKAIEIDPDYNIAITNLGLVYMKKGDAAKAVKTWSKIMAFPSNFMIEGEKKADDPRIFK